MINCQKDKKKIFFVIPNLVSGGAQRTLLNILNRLDAKKFKFKLFTFNKKGDLFKQLDKSVEVTSLNVSNSLYFIFKFLIFLYQEKPDIVFSTLRSVNFFIILGVKLSGIRAKVIIRETNNHTASNIKNTPYQKCIDYSYRYADQIIALSKGVAKDIKRRSRVSSKKIKVIYNPVNLKLISQLKKKPISKKLLRFFQGKHKYTIINVGHLEHQKGQDILIEAVSKLKSKINFQLLIIGHGTQKQYLEKKINETGLGGHVQLIGYVENPYNLMANSDLFVLSSRWEGFGHVLVEAMETNTPIISTNCRSGPSEIIKHNFDGILSKITSQSLANNITKLIKNQKKRKILIRNSKIKKKRFNDIHITKQYEEVFEKI